MVFDHNHLHAVFKLERCDQLFVGRHRKWQEREQRRQNIHPHSMLSFY